uniref:Uncharacterized protein n=1 Tax=Glossina pallidipes TaxID=7398 RepID=A0A1A9ZM33_GLOPL
MLTFVITLVLMFCVWVMVIIIWRLNDLILAKILDMKHIVFRSSPFLWNEIPTTVLLDVSGDNTNSSSCLSCRVNKKIVTKSIYNEELTIFIIIHEVCSALGQRSFGGENSLTCTVLQKGNACAITFPFCNERNLLGTAVHSHKLLTFIHSFILIDLHFVFTEY